MVFFGNSFGGGLALNLAQKMREENLDGLVVSVPLLTPVKYQEYPRAFWEIAKDRVVDGLAANPIRKVRRDNYFAEIPGMKKKWLRDLISGIRLINSFSIDVEYKFRTKSLMIRGDRDWVSRNYQSFNFDKQVSLPGGHFYFLRQYDKLFSKIDEQV